MIGTAIVEALRQRVDAHEARVAQAYRPLPYDLGPVCERCWMHTPLLVGEGSWLDYDRIIRTPLTGCPHGGGSDG